MNPELSIMYNLLSKSKKSRSIQIQDIKSKKARNIVRGIDPSSFRKTIQALNKIKNSCRLSDYRQSLLYIKTNPFFEGNGVGQVFNIECPKKIDNITIFSEPEIVNQIKINSDKLIKILEIATNIKIELSNNKLDRALTLCQEMIESKGTSVYLIKVLSYISNRYQLLSFDDTDILSKIDSIKNKIKLSNSNFLEEAVTQLSNLRTPHLALCKRILDINDNFSHFEIAKSFINPIPNNYEDYLSKLSSFFSFSLFDAYLYLKMTDRINLSFLKNIDINEELDECYLNFSSIEFSPSDMYEEINEYVGHYYLRECFLFTEQPRAFDFLAIHGYFYSIQSTNSKLSGYASNLISGYFQGVEKLRDLRCSNANKIEFNWIKYNADTCTTLENSSALIHILKKNQGVLDRDEEDIFVRIMSYTQDIGDTCHPDFLSEISNSAIKQQAKLVTQCLVTLNKKNQLNEHLLRSIIQDYCLHEFDGDLIKLLKEVHSVSPSVAEHLILACNETFLCTLFRLVEKPVDALQIRADMFQWFGEETNDDIYIDRAKTLRIDIQINKEKGTIDDSRIYVDELKYKQWFEDTILNTISMSIDNAIISGVTTNKLDWSKKNNSINNFDTVIEQILHCYKEFCENKVFGIASYLGRRIRHGTFKGTVITEVKAISSKPEYKHLFEDTDFKNTFSNWLFEYESSIENLVNDQLQIKSKRKPYGLITTEIDSPAKLTIAKQLVIEIMSIYSKRSGIIRLPSVIMDYCWRLAEIDLVRTKKSLSEFKSSNAVFHYNHRVTPGIPRKDFYKFSQDLNSITGQKFGLVSSWFNKPNYASPSTDIYLLFNVVVSEIKESYTEFKPKIDIGDRTFSVNGGTYYVIYDALYVLIHNAARHGKPDGDIFFSVNLTENETAIRINLNTEIENSIKLAEAENNIKKAFLVESVDDDAHIFEGKSGIKKIKRLEKEGSISNVKFSINEEQNLLCFEFNFELGRRGKYSDIDS